MPADPPSPTESARRVLDYSHYVEVVDKEENGVLSRFLPGLTSEADRLGVPRSGPIRFFSRDLGQQIGEYEQQRKALFSLLVDREYAERCPYCDIELDLVHQSHRHLNSLFGRIFVRACPTCGWWESSDETSLEDDAESYRALEVRRRSLLREYSVGGSEVPLEYLNKHVARHPQSLSYISPRRMEELVGKAFGEVMNCEAIHVGGPNDDGIDLLLINGERQYVVQVKRRSTDRAESVQGVREFIGAMVLHGHVNGLFVTTAPRFSPPAIRTALLAEKRKLVERIQLVDSARIVDVCQLTAHTVPPPWKQFALSGHDPPFDPGEESYFAFSTRPRGQL